MEQPIIHPSAVTTRPQVAPARAEATQAEHTSHNLELLVGIGAVFLGWAIVASWILLFVSCITGGRMLLNAW